MARFIKHDYYYAVEYMNMEVEEALEIVEDERPYCSCNWDESENCDRCYHYNYLYSGIKKYRGSEYTHNVIITWRKGFGDQFIIRESSYLDSDEYKEDMEYIKNKIEG